MPTGSLRVTTGHSYCYRKLDEFGEEYAASVEKKVKDETARLQKQHQAPTEAPSSTSSPPLVTEGQSQQSTVITADKGRKLVFDNFDFKQEVHSMTEQHQNIDVHWVTHLSVEIVSQETTCQVRNLLQMLLCRWRMVCVYQLAMSTTCKGKTTSLLLREHLWKYPVCHFLSLWSVSTYHTSTARKWRGNQKWYYIVQLFKNDLQAYF